MLRSILSHFGSLVVFSLFLYSCGDYRYTEEKNYVLHADTKDQDVQRTLRALIDKFNKYAGFTALHYSEKAEGANSSIKLVKGLQRCSDADDPKDKKIGCGQTLVDVQQDDPMVALNGSTPEQKTTYSLRMELDDEWFRTRMNAKDSQSEIDLMKLFFHETGHGLQMGHDSEQSSVMYPNISGDKDFTAFFRRVKVFFAI